MIYKKLCIIVNVTLPQNISEVEIKMINCIKFNFNAFSISIFTRILGCILLPFIYFIVAIQLVATK